MTNIKVIIKFQDKVYKDDIEFVESVGGEIKKELPLVSSISANLPEESIQTIKDDPYVIYIEEDKPRHILGFPHINQKKDYNTQIQTQNIQILAQTVPWGITTVRAPEVHTLGNRGKDIKVCIIDTGINYNHEDLKDNYKGGYNFLNETPDPMDDNGHGTHVSGTIAALDNNIGVIGVAPEASIYSLKTNDINGYVYSSTVINAINWAIINKMQIISMSFGGKDYSQSEKDACDAAYNAGILIVAAAGNEGGSSITDTVIYPAKYDSVIAVAATDNENNRTYWSSTGPQVELSAPGNFIYSTIGSGYAEMSGTSMACPHVSGVAALILRRNPTLTNVQVRNILTSTALDRWIIGKDWLYGYGLVDAKKAIDDTPQICQTPICNYIITQTQKYIT